MAKFKLGNAYTPNYLQLRRIVQHCNNYPASCYPVEPTHPFPTYSYSSNKALSVSNYSYNYDISNNIYDISNNVLSLEINLNENNLSITNVTLRPSTIYYTYTYNKLYSTLTINIPNLYNEPNFFSNFFCSINVEATRKVNDKYPITLNFSGTFSNINV